MMKSREVQAFLILLGFVFCVVLPSIRFDIDLFDQINFLHEFNSKMFFGIFHLNSLIFIGFSAFVLWLAIDGDGKKAQKIHTNKIKGIKEAEKSFDDFFDNKIGLTELYKRAEKNETISEVLKILKVGGIEEDLVLGIQKIYNRIDSSYSKFRNDYEYSATLMPIIGMIGTVAGLLIMFAEPTQAEDFEQKFAGLSLALATTLYASMITILWFKPSAKDIEKLQIELLEDFNNLEISIRKFYHKVNILEFLDQEMK